MEFNSVFEVLLGGKTYFESQILMREGFGGLESMETSIRINVVLFWSFRSCVDAVVALLTSAAVAAGRGK